MGSDTYVMKLSCLYIYVVHITAKSEHQANTDELSWELLGKKNISFSSYQGTQIS